MKLNHREKSKEKKIQEEFFHFLGERTQKKWTSISFLHRSQKRDKKWFNTISSFLLSLWFIFLMSAKVNYAV